jgi:hypothetical protein
MKKEVVIASAIAGLLSSLSAGDTVQSTGRTAHVNIDKINIDKSGKVLAPSDIQKVIRKKGIHIKGNGDKADNNCILNKCQKRDIEKQIPILKR